MQLNVQQQCDLIVTARGLMGDHPGHPEYERAITELTADLLGLPEDAYPEVQRAIRHHRDLIHDTECMAWVAALRAMRGLYRHGASLSDVDTEARILVARRREPCTCRSNAHPYSHAYTPYVHEGDSDCGECGLPKWAHDFQVA